MRKSNDIISSLALKRMCYILLRTWTEWWLNIGRHIKLTPSPQHLKQEKGKSRESEKRKRGKEEAHSFRKQKKKRMPYFPFPGRSPPCRGLWVGHIWLSPTGNSWLWNPTFVYTVFTSKTDKACFRTTFALQIASPREATRLSGTSAPVGEWAYNCLIEQ